MPEPTVHEKMDALKADQIRGFDVLERHSSAVIKSLEAHTDELKSMRVTSDMQTQALLRALERLDDH